VPHFPQLLLSLLVSTQAPLHSVKPDEQTHWPFEQLVPEGQTLPQLPQLLLSLLVLTQTPLQLV